jgi:hypothetical protein
VTAGFGATARRLGIVSAIGVGYVGVFPVVAGLLAVLFYRTVPVVAPAAPSPEK